MTTLHSQMVERFKDRIGFDATMRTEAPGRSVLIAWPDMLTAPGVVAQGWSVAADTTLKAPGGAKRAWVLRRGKEAVSVNGYVSASGAEAARQFFLAQAGNTMMSEVPYERGPPGIGTLCVSLIRPGSSSLLWVFHNVFTLVSVTDSPVDAVAIAKWLQAQYEANLIPSGDARFRSLPSVEVSSETLSVGQALDVTVKMNPTVHEDRYLMRTNADERTVSESRFPGPRAQLKALLPGHTAVEVYLIDRTTLLSSTTRFELQILDSRK
jgi:hypothetical protein